MRSCVCLLLSVALVCSFAGNAESGDVAAPGLTVEGRVAFTEGPAWDKATSNVYFSDIDNNRILRRDPTGAFHTYRQPSGRANGLAFDSQGRLIACEGNREGGNRRVTRTEADGRITVLTDSFGGKAYNSPNDLIIDSADRIYFTDPRYGDRRDMQIVDEAGKPIEGVYRIDSDGTVRSILTHEIDRPNGIALSHDEKTLYVAENNNDSSNTPRRLWKFTLREDGTVEPGTGTVLFDWKEGRGPDGMTVGPDGNLYVAAGTNFASSSETSQHPAGIYVIDPASGELLNLLAVPEDMITNCTFGGPDGRTLYITAGHKLWSLAIPAN